MSQPTPTPPTPTKRSYKRLIAVLILLFAFVLLPLCLFFAVFPWISEQSFTTIEELKVDELSEINVRLLNHPDPQYQDIGPVNVPVENFAIVLQPLRDGEGLAKFPASALLGEYRLRFKDGRRGTIRLRFQPAKTGWEDAPVWMEIGSKKYKLKGTLGPLWKSVDEATKPR
jgi:hypothetical protein